MILSTSNVAPSATITDNPVSATQDIAVVADGDYSSVYIDALPTTHTTTFTFAAPVDIGYVAIAGNISEKDDIDIQFDSVSIVNKSLAYSDPQVMVFKVDQTAVDVVDVIVSGSGNIAIIEIAMGDYFTVPRGGEQGGYKRPWSIPNREVRNAKSLNSSPIALLFQATTIKASLMIPNNIMADYDAWYAFLEFATTNTFYILEDDNELHSCAGFDSDPKETKAHAQTRLLGSSGISFSAYSKGMEILT